jgi:Methyltransferase domain
VLRSAATIATAVCAEVDRHQVDEGVGYSDARSQHRRCRQLPKRRRLRTSHGKVEPPTRASADPIWRSFGWRPRAGRRLRAGSLAFTLPEIANVAEVTGVDLVEAFVEFARAHNTDPRITFKQADARALPFEDNSFDCATERQGATIGLTVAGDRGFESLYPFQSGYWLVGMATGGRHFDGGPSQPPHALTDIWANAVSR